MPNSKKSNSKTKLFVDFKPAELRLNKEWIIVYYAKNPATNDFDRIRLRVPIIANKTERLKHAKALVVEINNKLYSGWSPFFEENGKNFKSFIEAKKEFVKFLKKQVAEDVFREDTFRSYNSNLNMIDLFVSEKKINIRFAIEFNKNFCVQYLDWIYMDRENSPRTRNNHLTFLKLFCNFLVSRGSLSANPTVGILPMKLPKKVRECFPEAIKTKIQNELKSYKNGFETLCMTTYFCFIRNQELAGLFVKDVDLQKGSIFINKEISKNKKDEFVTIPQQFIPMLEKHINGCDANFYLFSSKNYYPGAQKMPQRKIANGWDKIRRDLSLDKKYQFYSLKDTGITDLLNSGVPAIKVRDQARHYDIKITELYTSRNTGNDETIRNASIRF